MTPDGAAPHATTVDVVIVAGPTASGKSALALDLAEALDGTIINADSMQIYRALPILTAQPGPADLGRAPHRLYGVLDPSQRCSAAIWRTMAEREIRAVAASGRRPILVGGTGLYLKALTDGLAVIPDVPASVRRDARRRHATMGPTAFHASLRTRDPATAARIDPGNTQRVIRAWEVLEATGRGLADWQADPPMPPPADMAFSAVGLLPPRAALYAACETRFDAMLDAGALDELRAFLASGPPDDAPILKAVGVPELRRHLAGLCSLEEAAAAARQATRRYAKRQRTWFTRQSPTAGPPHPAIRHRISIDTQYSKTLSGEILPKIWKTH
ncbi:MAG: tRNA (adenosine(37)-N6)-dimethylallyltransferase MiaA [Inquilinaceae bacterium]